jgi:hypothetical protein
MKLIQNKINKKENKMWLTDVNYLWNNKRGLYGNTNEMLSYVRKHEKILPIGKPSHHSALTKKEFIEKYKIKET